MVNLGKRGTLAMGSGTFFKVGGAHYARKKTEKCLSFELAIVTSRHNH